MLHKNNFDALRLLGAFFVIYAHQHELMGVFSPLYRQAEFGTLGVIIFFSISGFLITGSWLADPNLMRFSLRRLLRIWPALAVLIFLCVFVLGPIATTYSTTEYFLNSLTWQYFHNLRFKFMMFLPGVFEKNPHTTVNGSLWTIPLEMKCYAIVAIVGIVGVFRWKYLILLVLVGFGFYIDTQYGGVWNVFTNNRSLSNEYIFVFLIGCAMALFKDCWMKRGVAAFFLASTISIIFVFLSKPLLGLLVFFAVNTLLIGTLSTRYIRDAGKYGDFSYGLYIYAFPVQQFIVWNFGKEISFYVALAASTVVTLIFSALSWHFIEKQALRFKPKKTDSKTNEKFFEFIKNNNFFMTHAKYFRHSFLISAALIVLVAIGLRFFQIGAFSFWDDEMYSIATATQPSNWYNSTGVGKNLAELQATDGFWVWKLSDPHPPLYEMLLSIWISLLGTSELAVRSLSAVFGVLVVVSAFALPAAIPRGARIVYAGLLAFSGPMLIYSQDARNYVMGMCLVAWMLALALRQCVDDYSSVQAGHPRIRLLVLAAMLMVTHFYGVILVFSFATVMTLQVCGWRSLLRASIRWCLTLIPLAVYVFFGWQGIVNKVGAGPEKALSFAMTFKRNTVELLHNFYPNFHATNLEFWGFFVFLLLMAWGVRTTKNEKQDLRFLIKLTAGVQLIFFVGLVYATQRIEFFSPRYLVFLIPGTLFLVSAVTFLTRWTQWLGAFVVVSLVAGGLRLWYLSPRPQNYNEWRDASALVAKNFHQGDLIVAVLVGPWMLEYYEHYLRKDIPPEHLKNALLGALKPETLDEQLAEKMLSKPPTIIVFSYVGLQGLEDLVVKTITARWPCQLDQGKVMGNIRVGTMRCTYP